MNYNEKKLKEYGFKLDKNKYILKYELDNNLYALYTIDKDLDVKVYDKITNEEFIPYKLNTTVGSYVSDIREKVHSMTNNILFNCFVNNTKQIIIDYIYEKYNIEGEHPWRDYPNHTTFKINNKWFGLIMRIPYKSLGINSIDEVDVINIKIDPEEINKLIDNKHYFKAYHMNKKYWITVVLDYNTDIIKLKKLIDESYRLAGKYESK